jgi:hypothetical protein
MIILSFCRSWGFNINGKDTGKVKQPRNILYFCWIQEDHSGDLYRMLNSNTNSIINSHDIIWLNKAYKQWKNSKKISVVEEVTIQLPIGIDKTKSTTSAIKDTEHKSNKSDEKVSGQ